MSKTPIFYKFYEPFNTAYKNDIHTNNNLPITIFLLLTPYKLFVPDIFKQIFS